MDHTNRLLIRLGKLDDAGASQEIVFSSTNLTRFYFPGRGIFPSFILHVIACCALFFPTLLRTFLYSPPPPDQVVFIDLNDPRTVMYLPPLQGSEPQPAAKQKDGRAAERPAPKAGNEGLSYPGLQPILSDLPEPTNSIQTILQPKLENPETLMPPLPLPNVIQTEETPMLVQSPDPEIMLPELELAEREPLQEEAMPSPAATIPDPLFVPSEDYPELQLPDLLQTPVTESQMDLPEPQMAPMERMRTPVQKPSVNASAPGTEVTAADFSKLDIPELLRTETEPESQMDLPESEMAPLQRMRTPVQKPAENAAAPRTEAPTDNSPKLDIPEPLRTGKKPETEMPLPGTQMAPIERRRAPVQKPSVNAPAPKPEAPASGFSKLDIPEPLRIGKKPETEMPLPAAKRAPMERLRPSGRKIPSAIPDTAYSPPRESLPKIEMPEMVKARQPNTSDATGPTEASATNTGRDVPSEGKRDRILNLSPMPALPPFQIEIPKGEAPGSFAISNDPNLATPSTTPGIRSEKVPARKPSETITLGKDKDTGNLPAGSGTTGDSAGTVDTNDDSQGPFLTPLTGPGENAFDGVTIIGGSEQQKEGTNSTFLAPVEKSNEGIEIINGSWDPGNAAALPRVMHPPPPIQTDYPYSIISTEDSGVVLHSQGFFKNTIYSVFVDMRESSDEEEQRWILEFGLLDDVETNPGLSLDFENYTEGLLPPFPIRKKRPSFPEALVRKHPGEMILVSGIVNAEGRMEDLSIMDNPEDGLATGLLETLAGWYFRPARLNGQPVVVKVLIGIPF